MFIWWYKNDKRHEYSNYQYSGYGISFDGKSDFTIRNTTNGKNVISLGADMSFSSHANNRANNIYVIGKDFIQGINGTTIYDEGIYKIKFTAPYKKFVLSLHYNGDNSYLLINGVQQLKFKSKLSVTDLKQNMLCVGNISSDWSITNSTKTGLHGNVYDFAVDYTPISGVKTIYDIHRYLMTKHNI